MALKKTKKIKKEKKWHEMSYEEKEAERSYQKWQQLNRKVKRDNFILYAGVAFILIYLFFQI
jgi:hypothetical protein